MVHSGTLRLIGSSLLSQLVFQWLGPFLSVGYSRPLEREDFWELPDDRKTANIAMEIEKNFYMRCPPEKRPKDMKDTQDDTHAEPSKERTSEEDLSEKNEETKNEETKPHVESLTTTSTQTAISPGAIKPATMRSRISRILGRKPKPQYDESLFLAVHRTFFTRIWVSGILKLFSGA